MMNIKAPRTRFHGDKAFLARDESDVRVVTTDGVEVPVEVSRGMISHKAMRNACGLVYGVTGNFLDRGTNPWMNFLRADLGDGMV